MAPGSDTLPGQSEPRTHTLESSASRSDANRSYVAFDALSLTSKIIKNKNIRPFWPMNSRLFRASTNPATQPVTLVFHNSPFRPTPLYEMREAGGHISIGRARAFIDLQRSGSLAAAGLPFCKRGRSLCTGRRARAAPTQTRCDSRRRTPLSLGKYEGAYTNTSWPYS